MRRECEKHVEKFDLRQDRGIRKGVLAPRG